MARILIAEDEPNIRLVLSLLVVDLGHEACEAPDGLAAIKALSAEPPPDLLIVDLFMPGASGKEVVAQLRADPRTSHVPVLVLSGAVLAPEVLPPAGDCQAVLEKPFEVGQVKRVIAQLLKDGGCPGPSW